MGGLNDPLLILDNQQAQLRVAGPQILNVGRNHWVVVCGAVGWPNVEVFDSLSNKRVHADIITLCNRMYAVDGVAPDRPLRFILRPLQQQVGGDDCGLFAIAVQDAIIHGLSVSDLVFDQPLMRSHLADAFRAGFFPKQGFRRLAIGSLSLPADLDIDFDFTALRLD